MKKPEVIRPFLPIITMDEIMAYHPSDPSTRTRSQLVNAVCEVLQNHKVLTQGRVAESMGLKSTYLSSALVVLTGHNTTEIRMKKLEEHMLNYLQRNPKTSFADMAQYMGFKDPSGLWRFAQRNKKRFPLLCRAVIKRTRKKALSEMSGAK